MTENRERKIPVFTVLKNGAVLKNIFLISQPPLPSSSPPSVSEHIPATAVELENASQEAEEILIVGRHPNCSIMLTHPSISRFHLQINSRPSSQKLSVIDLSSVHGTWVSEKKIEPGVSVELSEGDTIRVGGSTRVYRLHWIPFSSAYDRDEPFISPANVPVAEGDEEILSEGHEGHMNLQPAENEEVLSSDSILEHIGRLFSVENLQGVLKKEVPSAPPMPENITYSRCEASTSTNVESGMEMADLCSEPLRDVSMELSSNVVQIISETRTEQLIKDGKSLQNRCFSEPVFEEENRGSSSLAAVQITDHLDFVFSSSIEEDTEAAITAEILKGTECQNHLQEDNGRMNIFRPLSESLQIEHKRSSLSEEFISEINTEQIDQKEETFPPLSTMLSLPERENETNATMGHQVKEENQNPWCLSILQPLVERDHIENAVEGQKSMSLMSSPSKDIVKDAENQSPSTEKYESENLSFYESVNSSFPAAEVLSEVNEKNETPQALTTPQVVLSELENFENYPFESEKQSKSSSIWSRRGKPASILQIQTVRSAGKATARRVNNKKKSISRPLFSDTEEIGEELFTPDKENFTKNSPLVRSLKRNEKLEEVKEFANTLSSSSPKITHSLNTQQEDASPFSDKENFTPDTLLMRSLKRKGKLREVKESTNSSSSSFSKITSSLNTLLEDDITSFSDKENQTPKVLGEQKFLSQASRNQVQPEEEVVMKSGTERVPFQSLPVSAGKIKSEVLVSDARARSSNSFASKIVEKRINQSLSEYYVAIRRSTWAMVVDTTSLLDKHTRKSLQLLQGLKGTQLIIPQMVMRELDCLKRRGSLFGRTTEAPSVLEWIEDCMINTKWWIHIQSSNEDGRSVAPTPPATPQSQLSEGSKDNIFESTCSFLSSVWGSLKEIASPTAEDHILDCALQFRKMKDSQQLVLLSNDVTLKIKAMAEGMICETAEEFRDSLVNPFSERFLWADSSPRGQTWSFLDDVAMRERYNCCPLKKSSKGEGAKGLKLVLLHNSQYGRFSSVR